MIKIIHFLTSINYTNGVASLLMNYYRKIDRNKFQFIFITFIKENKKSYKDEIEKLGGEIYLIHSPLEYLRFKKELEIILEQYKNDKCIFHNHQIPFSFFLRSIVSKKGISKFIIHNHMTKYSDKFISSIRNFLLCIPIRWMKHYFFACSEEAVNLIYKNKKPKEFYIMKNSIDLNRFEYKEKNRELIRKKYNIKNDDFVIGHVGHFEPVKNHKFIFDIYDQVLIKNENIKLILIGNGSLKQKYERIIDQKKYKNVILLENKSDIENYLCAMDVFIFPSIFEGFGIAAIEAQASGLPIIMSENIPADTEINNCNRISLRDKNLWVTRILEISNQYVNEDRMVDFYNKKWSKYNIDNCVKDLEKMYYLIYTKDLRS